MSSFSSILKQKKDIDTCTRQILKRDDKLPTNYTSPVNVPSQVIISPDLDSEEFYSITHAGDN